MKKITAAATILVAIVVAAATLLFFLNQTDASNQTSEVRITAFSVDPEGWKAPPIRTLPACSTSLFRIQERMMCKGCD